MSRPEPASSLGEEARRILLSFGVKGELFGGSLVVRSPITGETIARLRETSAEEARGVIGRAAEAFRDWRQVPAPRRGELVRLLGEGLRSAQIGLRRLVPVEGRKHV